MSIALESMRERDRRVWWERFRANALKFAEWFFVLALAGGVGAAFGISYGIGLGKAQAEKRESERPKEVVKDCRERLNQLLDRMTPKRRGT